MSSELNEPLTNILFLFFTAAALALCPYTAAADKPAESLASPAGSAGDICAPYAWLLRKPLS